MNDASLIDHTLLAPDATADQVAALCREAIDDGFLTVCVSPTRVAQAAEQLAGQPPLVCTVVGFPSGAHLSAVKAAETAAAVADGADEIDMVLSLGAVRDGDWEAVRADIAAVVEAAGDALVKVILETALLSEDEITRACEASEQAGAGFVKTSTGFAAGGATVEAVAAMRAAVGDRLGVKASGGIRTAEAFQAMVTAGANRIGASAGATLLGR
ncbi:deoxyribose-phosphate aldolase [Brachybacterium ginsengisoli]|uniref:Deoxyribose-phosphate aldolase n=1 Tax=Brachybacterium ginsengisoli TaxID=1331682 RepID=A0A291GVN7_9MICO|nr:deoxyribose-phosphate aldolase [Brachybacterium ginsengisoli]ATG54164.1 deoxyribose-phosphate aldolase [Brachybacterium ginsengisoli]